jgi:hypothetical protein
MVVSVVVGALVLGVVGGWLRGHEAPPPRRAAAPGLTGTLVYAVDEGEGWSRLWRWDLARDAVREGPRVRTPVDLVSAYGANHGWIGVTSRMEDGTLQGSILRFLAPDDRAVPLVRGDLVSWGARGASVVVAHRGDARNGCREVSVASVRLVPSIRQRDFFRPHLCGDIVSIGRDVLTTFFTLERRGRIDTFFAGYHVSHLVLRDHAMLSVSLASDLIVVPASSVPFDVPGLGGRPDAVPPPLEGASLFFQGLGNNGPIAYGVGGERFAISRVMAWSVDSLAAIVDGRLGDRRGLYLVDGGPGDGIARPIYLGGAGDVSFATFWERGIGIVMRDGAISLVRDGHLERLSLPEDAPAPNGPIVWTP